MSLTEFESFGKITRYEKISVTITEKIDGTNACISFTEDGECTVQSRKRIIQPDAIHGKGSDNYGFAYYVARHEKALFQFFGPGRHYGEWFGNGINRGYGMTDRVFAPFNTHIYTEELIVEHAPEGITFLPVLWQGSLHDLNLGVDYVMNELVEFGSFTEDGKGWDAEGCMIYMHGVGYLKVPFDGAHKWEQQVAA